jgi:hypothetical protein
MNQKQSGKDAMIAQAAQKMGMNPDALKNALNSGSQENLLNSLSAQDAAALRGMLSNPAAMEKLMQSPQAQELFRLLGGK